MEGRSRTVAAEASGNPDGTVWVVGQFDVYRKTRIFALLLLLCAFASSLCVFARNSPIKWVLFRVSFSQRRQGRPKDAGSSEIENDPLPRCELTGAGRCAQFGRPWIDSDPRPLCGARRLAWPHLSEAIHEALCCRLVPAYRVTTTRTMNAPALSATSPSLIPR